MTVHWESLHADRPNWFGGGQWKLRGLGEITVVFGRNGSGKSLLLRGLNESNRYGPCHYSSPERAGDISYNQSFNERELREDNRGSERRRNVAPTYRTETVSHIGTLATKMGYAAGRGSLPNTAAAVFDTIENRVDQLLPQFAFKIKNEPPFYEVGGRRGRSTAIDSGHAPVPDREGPERG